MHRNVDAVVCQPLGGSFERNQRGDTATGKENLAILACEVSVQTGILRSCVAVNYHGVPVVTYFGLRRAGGGVAVTDNFGVDAIDPSGKWQFTNGTVTYASEPFAKADRGTVCVTEFFLAPIDGAGGLTPA